MITGVPARPRAPPAVPGPSQSAARRLGPVPAHRPPQHAGGLPTNVL